MKLKNFSPLAALALAAALTACTKEDIPTPTPAGIHADYLVLNQGNQYAGIDGSLDAADAAAGTYTLDAFVAVNGQSLGDTPQQGLTYGSKTYVSVFGSNLVWVIDRASLRILKQIPTNSPENLCAAGGYVFVSNNDGHVSRIDTASLAIDRHTPVGPNPANMTAAGSFVYVSISDGYNYDGGYANGKRVAVLSIDDCEKVKEFSVGLNPGPIAADADGRIFVVSRGNYADVQPEVQQLDPTTGAVTRIAEGSLAAIHGTRLYILSNRTDWATNKTVVRGQIYDTATGQILNADFFAQSEAPANPLSLSVHPATGELFITSDKSAADYDKPGLLYRYAPTGSLLGKTETGIHPIGVIF